MHAVIMAGGRGTRFWPRSREKKPKHLLDIISAKTIIQETVDRVKELIAPQNILVVTGKKHARELIKQLSEIPKKNIIIEQQFFLGKSKPIHFLPNLFAQNALFVVTKH